MGLGNRKPDGRAGVDFPATMPHKVSKPLDPLEQYRRWQFLEAYVGELEKVCRRVKNLEWLLPQLEKDAEKRLREVIWLAHDTLKKGG